MAEMADNGLQRNETHLNESYLKDIPTRVVVRTDEIFTGLKAFFHRKMAGSRGRA